MLTVKTSSSPNSPSFWSAVEEVVEPERGGKQESVNDAVGEIKLELIH